MSMYCVVFVMLNEMLTSNSRFDLTCCISELDVFVLGVSREPLMDVHEAYQVISQSDINKF